MHQTLTGIKKNKKAKSHHLLRTLDPHRLEIFFFAFCFLLFLVHVNVLWDCALFFVFGACQCFSSIITKQDAKNCVSPRFQSHQMQKTSVFIYSVLCSCSFKIHVPMVPRSPKKTANIPDVMPFLLGLPISSPPKSSQAFQVRPRLRGVGRQILEPRMVQGLRRRQPLRQVLLQQRRDEGTAVLADLLPATRLAGNLPWRIPM